jgi:uncharacterized OsmC-like protein
LRIDPTTIGSVTVGENGSHGITRDRSSVATPRGSIQPSSSGGMRVVSSHSNGTQLSTDVPTELGGSGDQVTPGWLVRAGLVSCLATRIAMGAAAAGFELATLEVSAGSRSDARGLLGMPEASGGRVGAGPRDVQVLVRIAAPGVSPERLRILIEESNRCSPVSAALRDEVPITMRIEVDGG